MKTRMYIGIKVLAIYLSAVTLLGLSAQAQSRQEILSDELLKSTEAAIFSKDSSYTYRWNETTSKWESLWKKNYEYNQDDNIAIIDYQLWNNNKWTNKWREVYTYNKSKQLIECEFLSYNSGTNNWDNSQVFTYQYNGSVLLSCLVEKWDATASKWSNWRTDNFIYDLNGRRKEYMIEYWNETSSVWSNSMKSTPVYNNNGNVTQETSQSWTTPSSAWANLSSESYTYNSQGQKTILLKQTWDVATNTAWINQDRFQYAYTNNVIGAVTHMTWNLDTKAWANSSKMSYKYDGDENLTEEIHQKFNTTTSGWELTMKQNSFWTKTAIETAIPKPESMTMEMYPNPAVDELFVTGIDENTTINIYDYNGKLIKSVSNYSAGTSIDVSDIAKGMYLIKSNEQVLKLAKK